MSTENIAQEAEEARRALGQVASATRRRAQEVRDAMRGLDAERTNVVMGARAAMRAIDDEGEELEEEVDQLRSILDGIELAPRPTRLVSPAPAANDEEDEDDDEVVVALTPTPPAPAPQPMPTAPTPSDATRRPHPMNCRQWRFWAWIIAFAGMLVCMIVASNTYNDIVGEISGFGRGTIATMWWVGLIGFGFFGGGTIGSFFDRD